MSHVQNASYAMPIRIHESGRYFEDQQGKPFFWHGDTCWKLFWEFSEEEAAAYLDSRAEQGFTVIQVQLLPHRFYQANRNGDEAFLVRGDIRTPNPAYFSFVDQVLAMAQERGVTLLIAPVWLSSWEQDWYQTYDVERAVSFSRFLAARYGENPYVLGWIHGGDDDAWPLHDAVKAGALMLKQLAPKQVNTFHAWIKGGWAFFQEEPWYDFYMAYAYSYENFLEQMKTAYGFDAVKPVILGETHYEGNTGISSAVIRRFAYTSVLLGGAGHTYGHKDIWCKTCFWQEALCSEASHHMRVLAGIFSEIEWQALCPVYDEEAVFTFDDCPVERYCPTAASGRHKLAYVSESDRLLLPLSAIGTELSWTDPVSGSLLCKKTVKERVVRIPGYNAGGERDWVVLLERD